MSIITLTTDLGLDDHYVGVLKGRILKLFPEAKIIDLSHNVKHFFTPGAAMIVRNSYREFPKGTVHLIGVAPKKTELNQHLAVEFEGHYFIGADNGMFPLIFERAPERVFDLSRIPETDFSQIFPTKEIFAVAASHLAQGGIMEVIGKPSDVAVRNAIFLPTIDGSVLRGMAIHIDGYGNVITNIDKPLFDSVGQGREFEIRFRGQQHSIRKISNSYGEVPEGEKMALFGSSGFLELAMNRSNASRLLGVKHEDAILIEFK